MIVLMFVVLISLMCSIEIVVVSEMRNRDTSGVFYPRIWCRKHGFQFREAAFGNSLGIVVDATMWYGEDSYGNRFVPDKNGMPVLLNKEGNEE